MQSLDGEGPPLAIDGDLPEAVDGDMLAPAVAAAHLVAVGPLLDADEAANDRQADGDALSDLRPRCRG